MLNYDLVVIGGGSGGLTAATIGGRAGAKTLLVDKTTLGGDCLHWGCVPSKALIASARMAHKMRRASEFGLAPVDVQVDFGRVMARIESIRDAVAQGESVAALESHGVEVAFGGATFADAHALQVGTRRVRAAHVIIATGSHPVPPSIPGLVEAGYLDNERVFQLTECPRRLVVIGGGPVGCELGQALHRLGARVTLVQRGERLLPREAGDVSRVIAEQFARESIEVCLGTEVERVERDGDDRCVYLKGRPDPLRCDEILVAVGRRPTVSGLGLGQAGVAFTDQGIHVDDALRTSQPHIFAVGDCNGGPQFTHWAEKEARVAARNALFKGTERRSPAHFPRVTFTDPEVASVGPTLAQIQGQDPRAHANRVPFSRLDRALCEGETTGFIEVVSDRKGRLVGVHIVGPGAGEVLTEWVLALEHGMTLQHVGSIVHAYPTLSRINRRVADERFYEHGVEGWLARLAANFDMPR